MNEPEANLRVEEGDLDVNCVGFTKTANQLIRYLASKKYPAMVHHRPLSLAAHNEVNLYVLVDGIHVFCLS